MINILAIFDDIGETTVQALRTMMGYISATLYQLIDYLYTVFIYIGKAEILDNDFVQTIYRKVGMILGIFMVFKLIFSLVTALIETDKLDDKKNGYGAIIKRSIISIVLLGITPSLFREAFNIQNIIVGEKNQDNVIYKLIVGKSVSGDIHDMGRIIASDLYFSFFSDDEEPKLNQGTRDDNYDQDAEYIDRFVTDNYDSLKERVEKRTQNSDGTRMNFFDTIPYLAIKDSGGKYKIEYHWFLSLAFGVFAVYIFALYCIQVGIRVVQLAYLQIIAPVPIISYISDPEGSFKNWTRQCFTTFLDLFFRLAIIYFVVFLIGDVVKQFKDAGSIIMTSTGLSPESDPFTLKLVKIFIIIGLLMFAKKVPELIKEVFPNLGGGAAGLGFGLKSPKQLLNDMAGYGMASKAIGWTGKKIGQGVKFAAKPITNKYQNWRNDKKAYKEEEAKDRSSQNVWNRYGADFENENYGKVFDNNEEYINSYKNLAQAKKNLGEAAKFGLNSHQYDTAKREFDKAKANHDINRTKYGKLARREDELKRYKDRNAAPIAATSYTNASSTSDSVSQSDRLQEIAKRQATKRPSSFTDEERRIEAERRESTRSSYNNEHEAELASQSIFSDDEAMRQSDMEYNTGVSRPDASSSGAPTAENSIFNDDEAMRQSDMEYMSSNDEYTRKTEKVTAEESVFANMSDSEWKERQWNNSKEAAVSDIDPNELFDKMNQMYVDEHNKNNGVSDEYDRGWENTRREMEESYKKAGWKQDSNGKWTKDN